MTKRFKYDLSVESVINVEVQLRGSYLLLANLQKIARSDWVMRAGI